MIAVAALLTIISVTISMTSSMVPKMCYHLDGSCFMMRTAGRWCDQQYQRTHRQLPFEQKPGRHSFLLPGYFSASQNSMKDGMKDDNNDDFNDDFSDDFNDNFDVHESKESSVRNAILHLHSLLEDSATGSTSTSPECLARSSPSIVHIVGSGLNPALTSLPLSTLFLLSTADFVLHDALGLSSEDIAKIVPSRCTVIGVGKRGRRADAGLDTSKDAVESTNGAERTWKQHDIDQLLLQLALFQEAPSSADTANNNNNNNTNHPKQRSIVRLKGGDPFLFGRTHSEISQLQKYQIPYTYTPALSSCIAGPHLGGIPLTDAQLGCQSFMVLSGTDSMGRFVNRDSNDKSSHSNNNNQEDNNRVAKDWEGLDVDVLVFLMIGRLDKLDGLCHSLIQSQCNDSTANKAMKKWNENTHCAIIQNAGGIVTPNTMAEENDLTESPLINTIPSDKPRQRVWRSTLGDIVSEIRDSLKQQGQDEVDSVSPAVFVVGPVAQLDLLSQPYILE